jgi:hypothetical protein
MANNRRNRGNPAQNPNDDWAQQVPWTQPNLPYRSYGWEPGESGLPEFRDPDIARMPEDFEEGHWPYYTNQGYYAAGEYSNQWENEMNSRRRNWRGVPGPYRGVGPKGYQRSDERISEDICELLTIHGNIDASDIDVNVQNGEVTLEGTVPNRPMKRLAEDVAESVSGVKDVHNRLHINRQNQSGQQSPIMQQDYRQAAGRTDQVGRSGVYPASAHNAPEDAEAQGMASWGQGDRGAAGYQDHGGSELDLGPGQNQEQNQGNR